MAFKTIILYFPAQKKASPLPGGKPRLFGTERQYPDLPFYRAGEAQRVAYEKAGQVSGRTASFYSPE